MRTTDRGGLRGPGRRAPDAYRVHGDKGRSGRSGGIASGAAACIDFD
ncbi:hypothetical protein [Burkholderia cepacia]|nr:hypothetical protein [Burkholderia cepacia]